MFCQRDGRVGGNSSKNGHDRPWSSTNLSIGSLTEQWKDSPSSYRASRLLSNRVPLARDPTPYYSFKRHLSGDGLAWPTAVTASPYLESHHR